MTLELDFKENEVGLLLNTMIPAFKAFVEDSDSEWDYSHINGRKPSKCGYLYFLQAETNYLHAKILQSYLRKRLRCAVAIYWDEPQAQYIVWATKPLKAWYCSEWDEQGGDQ